MTSETLSLALSRACRKWAHRPALALGEKVLTYGDLEGAVSRLARSYVQWAGLRRGGRVLTCTSNRPEMVLSMAAAWAGGGIHAGLDDQSTLVELDTAIRMVRPALLVYEPPPGGSADAVVESVQRVHPDVSVAVVGDAAAAPRSVAFAELLEAGGRGRGRLRPSEPGDPAVIFLSSGTTGRPKASLGYQGNLGERWTRLGRWLEFDTEDVHLAQLPLSHGFGLMMAVAALLTGGWVVLQRSFTGAEALDLIRKEGVTVLNGAPAHFRLVLERLAPGQPPPGTLRRGVGTGAAFPPGLVRAIRDRLGVRFMVMYGASEAVGVASTNMDDILLGAVGRPKAGTVAILGRDRRPLPVGETGEIAFSRREFPVRYWSDAAAEGSGSGVAAPSGDDEWFATGDLGRLDEEGRLFVLGRIKHQIDRGGLKVDPVEVEMALLALPGVRDAAILGRPNPVLGESVCACVVADGGRRPDLHDLRETLSRVLSPYKLPEELVVVDEIPRTPLGKTDLPRLGAVVEGVSHRELVRR